MAGQLKWELVWHSDGASKTSGEKTLRAELPEKHGWLYRHVNQDSKTESMTFVPKPAPPPTHA